MTDTSKACISAMMKHRLTESMCKIVEHVMINIQEGIVSKDGNRASSEYMFIGVEPLIAKYMSGKVGDWDFCEEIKELLWSDGRLTQKGKAQAYDLIIENRKT